MTSAALLLVVVVGGIWFWWQQAGGPEDPGPPVFSRPAPRPDGYAGSQACAECHADLVRSFQSHPMAHSSAAVESADIVEDYSQGVRFLAGGREYLVEKSADGIHHHERVLIGEQLVYDQAEPIRLVIGSGQRGRSYALLRNELLFLSPIAWYASDGRWDLSPGYRAAAHQRFGRRVTGQCVECHVGRINAVPEASDRFAEPLLLEAAIGCERCHGPGQAHIDWHSRAENRDTLDPIVNPDDLEPHRRDAVCNQCHLQGNARILRYGRSPHDFRPGDAIGDIWTVFVDGTGVAAGTTRAVSQVQQMRASRCWQQSDGRMGCTSCHDPHRKPAESERVEFYRSRCHACHTEPDDCGLSLAARQVEANDCTACHMPRLDANDIPHTTQTDHRVLRRPGDEQDAVDGAEEVVFEAEATPLEPLELDRARGLRLADTVERSGDAERAEALLELLEPVVAGGGDDAVTYDALAIAAMVAGRMEQAEQFWKAALKSDPTAEAPLLSLALLNQDCQRMLPARSYFERYVKVNPANARAWSRYSRVLAALGRTPEALSAVETAVQLDPTVLEDYEWWEEMLKQTGQADRAKEVRAQALLLFRARMANPKSPDSSR